MKKAEAQLFGLLAIIGFPFYIFAKIAEGMGETSFLILIFGVMVCAITYSIISKKKRKRLLLNKYNDPQLVEKILRKCFWQGQTTEQLLDSLGKPRDIDEKILKTKIKEIWKYNHRGANRYGLRITLENGYVVGWDQRD